MELFLNTLIVLGTAMGLYLVWIVVLVVIMLALKVWASE